MCSITHIHRHQQRCEALGCKCGSKGDSLHPEGLLRGQDMAQGHPPVSQLWPRGAFRDHLAQADRNQVQAWGFLIL